MSEDGKMPASEFVDRYFRWVEMSPDQRQLLDSFPPKDMPWRDVESRAAKYIAALTGCPIPAEPLACRPSARSRR
jgi:hypothetical protein